MILEILYVLEQVQLWKMKKIYQKSSVICIYLKFYTKGFIQGCQGQLTLAEMQALPLGALVMTFECGMRFLTDYLQGDTYFKIQYSTHNLDRCRTQLKLVADMEKKWNEMNYIVEKYIS